MIKRIIGLLAAAVTIAIIVFAVLNREKYSSMLDGRTTQQTAAPAAKPAPAHRAAPQPNPSPAADSLAIGRE